MSDLRERKRLLILEGELHRALIANECVRQRARAREWRESAEKLQIGGRWLPWLLTGGALAGALASRRWPQSLRWIGTAAAFLRWWQERKPR